MPGFFFTLWFFHYYPTPPESVTVLVIALCFTLDLGLTVGRLCLTS